MPERLTNCSTPRARCADHWSWVVVLVSLCGSGGCASLLSGARTEQITAAREMSMRGLDAMQRGQWSEAEQLFHQAIAKCPVDERARCHYAETLWHRGAQEEAVRQMEEAVRLSGGNPALSVRLGEMQLARRNLAQAAAAAEEAIGRQQELPRAWALHGDVLLRRGRMEDALASYHRALSYQEHFPHVQLAVAEIYRREGRPARALGTLMALSDQYPIGQVPAEVLVQRGLALKELQRYDDAVKDLARARDQGVPDAELLFQLGEAQLLAGDPVNANLALLQALEQAPQHGPARRLHRYLEDRHPGMTASLRGHASARRHSEGS